MVKSTSSSVELQRINLDGSVDTLIGNVGAVVDVLADLDSGFGGRLFANASCLARQFEAVSFAASSFGSAPTPTAAPPSMTTTSGYGALADLISSLTIARGAVVDTITGVTRGGASGLDREGSGNLIILLRDGTNISPLEHTGFRLAPTLSFAGLMLSWSARSNTTRL